ncbi:MAG TPA: glycosyltransferase, partial [Patescibacteria group bacterium]|nr:glycosyltransferase [Patescibacteria group bacterium]
MKVALVYDRVNKWGGAERVLLALHKIFPDAPLFTSVYNQKTAPWATVFNIKTSFLQNFPKAQTSHELYASLMPLAFESFNFDDYNLVISVTSEAAKGIITKPKTRHICYCLTPTRYLWSGYNDYFKGSIFRLLSKPAVAYLRNWDKVAAQRPDEYIAISTEVQSRIKRYYNRESEIIYPPSEMANGIRSTGSGQEWQMANGKENGDYFLVVSRLTNFYKRVDLAIKACNELQLPLEIVGSGSDKKKLQKMAGPTVEFLGNLTDKELAIYYQNCRALIFPGHEDFGLTMVEAQSFGKPVIAYRGGGALDIIKEGVTGTFFDQQTVGSLKQVLKSFNKNSYNTKLCRENAERFTFAQFE